MPDEDDTNSSSAAASSGLVVVLSGTRDKTIKNTLIANGHTVADRVTKAITHVVSTGEETTKTKRAAELEITVAQAKAL